MTDQQAKAQSQGQQEAEPGHDTVPGFIISDMRSRILSLETNLPPRVQALESAVSEITTDLRAIREEQREARRETKEAVDGIREAVQEEARIYRDSSTKMQKHLDRLTRRITFASGAAWAGAGILGFALYHWRTVIEFAHALETFSQ